MSWFSRNWNYPALPPHLVRYILPISLLGPVMAMFAAFVLRNGEPISWSAPLLVLFGLAIASERFPLHLTHKTNVNMATAVYVAMLVVLPTWMCPLVVLVAVSAAQAWRCHSKSFDGFAEPLFNIGQTSLYVTAAALVASVIASPLAGGPHIGPVPLFEVLLIALTLHISNTLLVARASALHLSLPTMRVWKGNFALDAGPVAAMTLVGICAAALAAQTPWLIPALFVPAVLIHRAVRESVTLRENVHRSLESLVEIIELRDPYTAGHSRRVAITARAIANELGLTAEDQDTIESAGRVHDVGKVGISPAVLTKSGPLAPDERAEMRTHAALSAKVISAFEGYQHGVEMVRSHHEAWDGTGYPHQLTGEEIPLGARILAVADTFDALTSDRPYRKGMPIAKAVAILEDGAGSQWDSAVVAAFLAVLARSPHAIPVGVGFVGETDTALAA